MQAKVIREFDIVYPGEVHGRRHVPGDVISHPGIAEQAIRMGVADKHSPAPSDAHKASGAGHKPPKAAAHTEAKAAAPPENK